MQDRLRRPHLNYLNGWCVTGLSLPASILLLLWMHKAPCSMMTHCLRLVLISCANQPWLVDKREIFQDCFWSSASPKGMYMEHQVFCIKALLADVLLTEKQLMCTSYLMASSSQLRTLGVFLVLFIALVFYCNSIMAQAKRLNRFRPHSLQDGPADSVWLGRACPTFVWFALTWHLKLTKPPGQCHIVTTNAHLGWCCPKLLLTKERKVWRRRKPGLSIGSLVCLKWT